jgi:hypothetical protein
MRNERVPRVVFPATPGGNEIKGFNDVILRFPLLGESSEACD